MYKSFTYEIMRKEKKNCNQDSHRKSEKKNKYYDVRIVTLTNKSIASCCYLAGAAVIVPYFSEAVFRICEEKEDVFKLISLVLNKK